MVLGSIIGSFLVYDTVKYARIKHTGLGFAFYAGCLGIVTYIVVFEVMISGGHLHREDVRGWARFALSTPSLNNCDVANCFVHRLMPDEHLPYCERFVEQKDEDKSQGSRPKQRLPCAMFDARDADMGNSDDSVQFVPTRMTIFSQKRGCQNRVTRESGFRVNHSSFFCEDLWSTNAEADWDGYVIDPERFRVMILHGFDPISHKTGLGPIISRRMEGFIEECQIQGADEKKEHCERKKIPCFHKLCGMTNDEKNSMLTPLKSSSSFIDETQGIADRQKTSVAARSHNSHSSLKNSNLRLGLQSHLGFLEFIPPNAEGSEPSQYKTAGISQDNLTSGSIPDSTSKSSDGASASRNPRGKLLPAEKRETWRRVSHNIDKDIAPSVDIDSGIFQGKHALVTSIGFLLRLAGVSSLDEELKQIGWNGTYVPRDVGLNLQITFEYTNVPNGMKLFPMSTPTYTMKVRRGRPSMYMYRKRIPEEYTIDAMDRKELHTTGVKIMTSHVGDVASFDFAMLIIVLTSGLGLLTAMQATLDAICTYLLPLRREFKAGKYIEMSIEGLGDTLHESDEDVPLSRNSKEASGVASVEDGENHVMSMMKAMEQRLKEISAKDAAREAKIKEMEAKDCAKEETIRQLVAKDCAKEERLKEMATKIARLEASASK